jgi:hypothetical protein
MRIAAIAAAAAVAAALAMTSLPRASASPTTARLGTAQTIEDRAPDIYSSTVYVCDTSYTVANLQPSNDIIDAPLAGRLWEATVTVNPVQCIEVPGVPLFNARSADGDNYRVLYQVAAPNGLSAAPVPPGGQATGKIYFDVTGPPPTEVVLNDGLRDRSVWN